MAELHVLRVFVDERGEHGNELGVFLDGAEVAPERRQAIAAELGFAETVFVDDARRGELRIFTPAAELPLAGHPLVGTSWLLRERGAGVDALRPPAGEVPTWREGDLTWIEAPPEWAPAVELRRLDSPEEVDRHPVERLDGDELVEVWAWEDERAGRLRARVFAGGVGIPEDEATGAAALVLGGELGRELTIRQGRGSILHAGPGEDGRVRVGGRVVLDRRRRVRPRG